MHLWELIEMQGILVRRWTSCVILRTESRTSDEFKTTLGSSALAKITTMTNLADHPFLFLVVSVLSYPIYLGVAHAIFGGDEAFKTALQHLRAPSTWSPLRDPWASDWNTDLKLFFFTVLCISYVAAACHLCVRYLF
jgi:hypothetical protein